MRVKKSEVLIGVEAGETVEIRPEEQKEIQGGTVEVPFEKKTRERKDKYPGMTMVPIPNEIYEKFAAPIRTRLTAYSQPPAKWLIETIINSVSKEIAKILTVQITEDLNDDNPQSKIRMC